MLTLGEQLKQNIQREKQAAEDRAAALDQCRTEEARRNFATAKAFFDEAREFFTQGILQRKEISTLYLQVGGAHFNRTNDAHSAFAEVLGVYDYRNGDIRQGPASLYNPRKLESLWLEFQKWATENDLRVFWTEASDGAGMESWWVLRIEAN